MWATCNNGAKYANEYGNLCQYGCPSFINHYYTSDECFENTGYTYCPPTPSRTIYAGENLKHEDDMAYDGLFRMPTMNQINELISNTSYEPITIDGINGVLFTSKVSPEHRMFITYGGAYDGIQRVLVGQNDYLNLWSSTSYADANLAQYIHAYTDYDNNIIFSTTLHKKIDALSVRGVCILNYHNI